MAKYDIQRSLRTQKITKDQIPDCFEKMVDCLYHRIGKIIQYPHSSLLESRPESIVGKSTHKEFQKEIAHKHYFEIGLKKHEIPFKKRV